VESGKKWPQRSDLQAGDLVQQARRGLGVAGADDGVLEGGGGHFSFLFSSSSCRQKEGKGGKNEEEKITSLSLSLSLSLSRRSRRNKMATSSSSNPYPFAPISASDDLAGLWEAEVTTPLPTLVSEDAARAKLVQWTFAVSDFVFSLSFDRTSFCFFVFPALISAFDSPRPPSFCAFFPFLSTSPFQSVGVLRTFFCP